MWRETMKMKKIDLYYIGYNDNTGLTVRARYTPYDAIDVGFDTILFIEVTEGRGFIQSGSDYYSGFKDGRTVGNFVYDVGQCVKYLVTLPIMKKGTKLYDLRGLDYYLGYIDGVLSTSPDVIGFYHNWEAVWQFIHGTYMPHNIMDALHEKIVVEYGLEYIWIPATGGRRIDQLEYLQFPDTAKWFTYIIAQPNYYRWTYTVNKELYTYDMLVNLLDYINSLGDQFNVEFETNGAVLYDANILKRSCDYVRAAREVGMLYKYPRSYYHDVILEDVVLLKKHCNWL